MSDKEEDDYFEQNRKKMNRNFNSDSDGMIVTKLR